MIGVAREPPAPTTRSGSGLLLMRAYMDEVSFNAAGNRVTLAKRRTRPPAVS